MARFFFDTSALFKRYVDETGSDRVREIFSHRAECFISSLTLVEMISNFRRLVDVDRSITQEDFQRLRSTLMADIAEAVLEVVETRMTHVMASLDLSSKKYITPIDALQLSMARRLGEDVVFVCADQKLARLAREEGLVVFDPAFPEVS